MKFVESYKAGRISLEDARGYAFKHLETKPLWAVEFFTAGIITREEARPIAFKVLAEKCERVDYFFRERIITREEARPYAFKALEKYTTYRYSVQDFLGAVVLPPEGAKYFETLLLKSLTQCIKVFFFEGIITPEEARPYALKCLKEDPEAFTQEEFRELVTYSSPVLNQLARDGFGDMIEAALARRKT